MSTVIKNNIHTARKYHECDSCRRQISPGMKYRRLYGSAHFTDPVSELKLCDGCTDINETDNDGHSDILYKW